MPTNSYDLIVIGDDFSGLVAATLCAKRGMRVLILSQGRPHSYQLGPYKLPVAPLFMPGASKPPIRRVFDELSLSHLVKRKLRDSPASFQFVAPDLRIDVSPEEHLLAGEIERELGEGDRWVTTCMRAGHVARHFDDVLASDHEFPATGFFKRREVGKAAGNAAQEAEEWYDEARPSDTLRALVNLPGLMTTRTGAESISATACARSFHLWHVGAPRLRGDWEALRELFTDRLGQSNGEIRTARVAELTFSWGKVNGVRLESGEELGATHVIAAIGVAELVDLIGRKVPKRLAQCVEATSIAGYRYTLNLVVDEAGIPEGLTSPVFLVGDLEAPLVGDNAIAIFVDEADAEARVAVTVTAVCPPPREGELDDAFADLRVRLRERIDQVMPFYSEHVLAAHSPHETAPPEGLSAELGKGLPAPPIPVWTSTLDAALGVSAVPYSVGVKHLTVASSQVLPQLGVEGAFVTGWCAAKIVCDAAGRKRDYLKDEVISGM